MKQQAPAAHHEVEEAMNPAEEILAMERAALHRWGLGDPDGFLEICAPEVVYFDPYLERRIDGLAALRAYYASLAGKVRVDRFELSNPLVQVYGGAAVLTFNYVSWSREGVEEPDSRWNCTEVFASIGGRWRLVQTHWSLTQSGIGGG